MDKPHIIEHVSKSIDYTVFGSRWVPSSARLVAFGQRAAGTGALEVYELRQGALHRTAEATKKSGFKCGTFGASRLEDRHLATGSFGGDVQVWDLERLGSPVWNAHRKHSAIVNCIDGVGGLGIGGGAPELATGSRDGSVLVWDTRVDEPVVDMSADGDEATRDCWGVAFGNSFDSERMVCAGYDNGDVKLFDLRAMKVRWEHNFPSGVCSVQFDRKDINMNKLLVTCLESKFHVVDLRTQHETKGFAMVSETAHKSTIWCGAHVPQNRDIFMTCGGNGGLSLWKYRYPPKRSDTDEDGQQVGVAGTVEQLQSAMLSTQPVGCLDWHADKLGLFTTAGFDQSIRVGIVPNLNLQ